MAYRKVYFRIRTEGYTSGCSSDGERAAFKEESCCLFQELRWAAALGHNGGCDTVTKDQQDLYLYPSSFSGVLDEDNIQPLQAQLSKARAFRCYHVDRYEEYQDLSNEGYRAELEAKRDEITDFILKQCRTKRSNLYIVAPIAACVAEQFEICRLYDKDRHNKIGHLGWGRLFCSHWWLCFVCLQFLGGYGNSFPHAFQLYWLHHQEGRRQYGTTKKPVRSGTSQPPQPSNRGQGTAGLDHRRVYHQPAH